MEIKAVFSVLYYNGKKGTKTQKFECPDFEDIVGDSPIREGEKFTIPALDQADEWLAEQDKSSWMNSNDIEIIFDWNIVSCKKAVEAAAGTDLVIIGTTTKELVIKPKKLSNADLVELYVTQFLPAELKNDFVAVYATMKDSIKTLNYEKQIEIVNSGMKVAYKSANSVFDRLNEIREEVEKEYSDKKNKKLLNN